LDEATLEIKGHESRIERVRIAHNLRHDQLDSVVTEPWCRIPVLTMKMSHSPCRHCVSSYHFYTAWPKT
jgi:exoribonuclease-2